MPEYELELTVGESVCIGDYVVTLIETENGEACLQIEELPFDEVTPAGASNCLLPR